MALPQIGAGLGASVSGLQWVVDGYALALAALLLAGGTIGDLRGHKPIVLTGLTVFGIASAACGLAPSTGVLIASRVVPVYRDGTPIATVSATAQPTTSDTAATRRDILRQLTDSGTVLAGAHVGPLPSPPVAPRDEPR